MKKIILVGVLAVATGVAHAAEWWLMQSTSDELWFVDRSSVASVDGGKVAWLRVETRSSSVTAGGKKRELSKMMAYCKVGTLQRLANVSYSANGNVLESSSMPGSVFYVVPDSIGENLYRFMCGLKKDWPTNSPTKDPAGLTERYFSAPG